MLEGCFLPSGIGNRLPRRLIYSLYVPRARSPVLPPTSRCIGRFFAGKISGAGRKWADSFPSAIDDGPERCALIVSSTSGIVPRSTKGSWTVGSGQPAASTPDPIQTLQAVMSNGRFRGVDLRRCSFCESSGALRALVGASAKVSIDGCSLLLIVKKPQRSHGDGGDNARYVAACCFQVHPELSCALGGNPCNARTLRSDGSVTRKLASTSEASRPAEPKRTRRP